MRIHYFFWSTFVSASIKKLPVKTVQQNSSGKTKVDKVGYKIIKKFPLKFKKGLDDPNFAYLILTKDINIVHNFHIK